MIQIPKPIIVGLTGQSGAGKTTVSRAFEAGGFAVINCDAVARDAADDPDVLVSLRVAFGDEIFKEDGTLDRRMLGTKAFSSPEQLEKLDGIMHDPIMLRIQQQIDGFVAEGKRHILLDAPTLFESGAASICSKKISVLADEDLRLARIIKRDGITAEAAKARFKAQHGDRFYAVRSDYILRNEGKEEDLYGQGEALCKSFFRKGSQNSRTVLISIVMVLSAIVLIGGSYQLLYRQLYPIKYQDTVMQASVETAVTPDLLYAVIKCSSNFNPDFYDPEGHLGLMGITNENYFYIIPPLVDMIPYSALSDPEKNLHFGAKILEKLYEEFEPEQALSVYYCGYGNDETNESRKFARDVLSTQQAYQNLYK